MRSNLSFEDRLFRLVLAIVLLSLYPALENPIRQLAWFGLLPLGASITGWSALYAACGISTARRRSSRSKPTTIHRASADTAR